MDSRRTHLLSHLMRSIQEVEHMTAVVLGVKVHFAFLAGLAVVLLLIPVNRWLAQKIQRASIKMMAHKDARVRVLGELLRGIYQIKLATWESRFVAEVLPANCVHHESWRS